MLQTFDQWRDNHLLQESYEYAMNMNYITTIREHTIQVNLDYINPELLLQVQEASKHERL